MNHKKHTSIFQKTMKYIKWGIVIFVVGALWLIWFLYFSGRTPSRYFGESAAQVLTVPNMTPDGFISLSFDKR